jgi:hypothetical protein
LLELASGLRTSQIKRRIAMLSKQETRGLARWKPLWILPLAVIFVLAFAESRTVIVQETQEAQKAQEAVKATPAQEVKPAEAPAEEEMMKALKEKWAKLEAMKKDNAEALSLLKQKLEETADLADKEKIQAKLKDLKIQSLEIEAKERMLRMKKLEYFLQKEVDKTVKAKLEKELQQLKLEAEQQMQKIEAIKAAELKAKQQETEKLEETERK